MAVVVRLVVVILGDICIYKKYSIFHISYIFLCLLILLVDKIPDNLVQTEWHILKGNKKGGRHIFNPNIDLTKANRLVQSQQQIIEENWGITNWGQGFKRSNNPCYIFLSTDPPTRPFPISVFTFTQTHISPSKYCQTLSFSNFLIITCRDDLSSLHCSFSLTSISLTPTWEFESLKVYW